MQHAKKVHSDSAAQGDIRKLSYTAPLMSRVVACASVKRDSGVVWLQRTAALQWQFQQLHVYAVEPCAAATYRL